MAQPRYYDDDTGEREPLDNAESYQQHAHQWRPHQYRQQGRPQQRHYQQEPYTSSPPRARPGAHPDSSFDRPHAQRRYRQDRPPSGANSGRVADQYAAAGTGIANNNYRQPDLVVSPVSPPQPPPHHDADGQYWGQDTGYPPQARQAPRHSIVTPGADNFGEAAAGGMAGIALTVAEQNARESGLEALRGPNYPQQTYRQQGQWQNQGQGYNEHGLRGAGDYHAPQAPYGNNTPDRDSQSSLAGLNAAALPPGNATPGQQTPSRSPHSFANEIYTDDPYQQYSRPQDPHLGVVNPHDIADDGDDGLEYGRKGPRTSMLSLGGGSSHRGRDGATAAGAAAGAATAGGVIGGLVGRGGGGGSSSGKYAPVQNNIGAYEGSGSGSGSGLGSGANASTYDLGQSGLRAEKPGWQSSGHGGGGNGRKWRLAIIIVVGLLIAAGIALGIVFGVVLKNKSGGNSSSSAAGDTAANGDLDINSPEIQSLLNNANLHKVFPGIDYTPLNTQYPDCIHDPPSQNNVTRDVAVLSQLTNTIRLYGTDCNQTEMLLHSINQLKMQDSIKVWLGVWQDNNATTNARQLAQMWDILDTYGEKPFKGVIVANEILFREQMTVGELGLLLSQVRTNITDKGMSLPVATSDLGDKWTAALAAQSDYIMANIHPFFAGANAKDAASWTYSFWHNKAQSFFKADASKNVISETGWPSQGGTDCGTDTVTVCPDASVAGISQMNQFMEDWVCPALENGTNYFWFEAFDEPWKITFDSGDQNWEDHWGLMDVDRNLKDGVKIPDCGGKTVS